MDLDATLAFLGRRAIAGVETYDAGRYTRTIRAAGGPARISLRPAGAGVTLEAQLTDPADLPEAIACARRLLDLDADPTAIDERLAAEPLFEPLLAVRPGLRSGSSE